MSKDANFMVWRRSLRGPAASLDHLDPRQLGEASDRERLIAVFPLTDSDRQMSLDTLMVLYPCTEISS